MEKIFVDTDGQVEEIAGEQRRHIRFPMHLTVRYRTEEPVEYTNLVLNVSTGGVFIQTDKPFPEGTYLVMHFFIPPNVKLLGVFSGIVAWTNTANPLYPKGMGISFTEYSAEAMRRLCAYLEGKKPLLDIEG